MELLAGRSLRTWLGCADYASYTRGRAYLKAKQGKEAAAEFQELLDHRRLVSPRPFLPSLTSQLGRARVLAGDNAGARTAYQDFFACGKMPTRMFPS